MYLNEVPYVGGGGMWFCDNMNEYISKTPISAWQIGGGGRGGVILGQISLTSFMNAPEVVILSIQSYVKI